MMDNLNDAVRKQEGRENNNEMAVPSFILKR